MGLTNNGAWIIIFSEEYQHMIIKRQHKAYYRQNKHRIRANIYEALATASLFGFGYLLLILGGAR